MGYAANGFCFDTPDAAAAFACGHDYPLSAAMVDATGNPASVLIECTASAGNVLTLQRDVNGAVQGSSTLALTAPACDETDWMTYQPFSMSATTGTEVALAVCAVWFAAWGWKAVYAVLRARGGERFEDE